MTALVFAAAQCSVRAGDMPENIRRHLVFMDMAHRHGVRFLLFPELSLTGYEPALADAFARKAGSPALAALLAPLRARARDTGMTVAVGLPLRPESGGKPLVAACILHADGALTVHTKQHLHGGEERYFGAGAGGGPLAIGALPVALSICADFGVPGHAADAARAGARLYAASVLVGEGGYATDTAILAGHARTHRMAVLMANHGGATGGWSAAGRSAFWNDDGALVAAVPGPGDHLLVVAQQGGAWKGKTVAVETADAFVR
jgi:predicted amidohydrolase